MIKFTDVCKAYIRYWYVILVCVVLALSAVMVAKAGDQDYTAKSTILVDKNETVAANEFISQAYAESVIKETAMMIKHQDFAKKVINEVAKTDEALAQEMDFNMIKRYVDVAVKKDATFFEISFTTKNMEHAKLIVDSITEVAVDEYGQKEGTKAKLVKVYSTELVKNKNKVGVFVVIGILIGLVLGVVLITFFVVFNPFVENRELLEKETAIPVLAEIAKAGGKNED